MRIAWGSVLALSLFFCLPASPAWSAPGVGLRWDSCHGDGTPINRNFACNTNVGQDVLVGSFEIGHDLIYQQTMSAVIDFAAASAAWPAWWTWKDAGTYRQTSIILDYTIPPTAATCADWTSGQGFGSQTFVVGAAGPNTARLMATCSVAVFAPATLAAQEYFAFRLRITRQKTVGTGACAGCSTPICIVLNSITVTDVSDHEHDVQIVTNPMNGTDSHYATWQGGGSPTTSRGTGCPAATPTKRGTWSGVKALYR